MKKFLSIVVVLAVVAAAGYTIWMNWGPQLALLPGQVSGQFTRLLAGMFSGLAGFGSAVTEGFRSAIPK